MAGSRASPTSTFLFTTKKLQRKSELFVVSPTRTLVRLLIILSQSACSHLPPELDSEYCRGVLYKYSQIEGGGLCHTTKKLKTASFADKCARGAHHSSRQ